MPNISAQNIWKLNPVELQALLDSGQLKPTSQTIRFYAPSFTYYKNKRHQNQPNMFQTVSVTGNACSLNCGHCGGEVLKTMHSATEPEQLYSLATKLKQNGGEGMLVSGGCMPDGSVPLDGFVPVLDMIKRLLGLTVFVHTGIVNNKTAGLLKQAAIDAVLIDVLGSKQTIAHALNFKVKLQNYIDSLTALDLAGLKVVPHVIVGLDNGALGGEYQAFKIIQENCTPEAIIIIAFMPIRGTEMAQSQPPKPLDIAKVVAVARRMFPKTPVALGCMRPKGKTRSETDILALKAGVDSIAFPSTEAIQFAEAQGYKTVFSGYCCAQLHRDLTP
jgi:uncharacterized radical SAM superfamily protein